MSVPVPFSSQVASMFAVPVFQAQLPDPAALNADQPYAGKRALVVDDHPLNRELAAAMLKKPR